MLFHLSNFRNEDQLSQSEQESFDAHDQPIHTSTPDTSVNDDRYTYV